MDMFIQNCPTQLTTSDAARPCPVGRRHRLAEALVRRLVGAATHCIWIALGVFCWPMHSGAGIPPLPERLSQTGLYLAGSTAQVDPDNLPFSPQYPLWTDGVRKRRWIRLPAGSSIDARHGDAWDFPPGTRLWKEFSLGRPIETRMIERLADGSWRFATYIWDADGQDAVLAPAQGVRRLAAPEMPTGVYAVPSQTDCLACHDNSATPVLGFSALQLSPARDPNAPHTEPAKPNPMDLRTLQQMGLLKGLSAALSRRAPAIFARTSTERAALGYLHANCGHCHNDAGPLAALDMNLQQLAMSPQTSAHRTLASLTMHAGRLRQHSGQVDARVADADAAPGLLLQRLRTSEPMRQMPPLGVSRPDAVGIDLVRRWITQILSTTTEHAP